MQAQGTETLTTNSGAPVADNTNSLTAGPRGPVMLEDYRLLEKIAQFEREQIPERIVHARGAAAFGTFEATADLSDITDMKVFSEKGKETPIQVTSACGHILPRLAFVMQAPWSLRPKLQR